MSQMHQLMSELLRRTSENAVQEKFAEFTFRNCLENSRRPLECASCRRKKRLIGAFRPLLAAVGAPIWNLYRFSKQFQKENSRKFNFRFTEFSEVAPSQAIRRCAGVVAMASWLCSPEQGLAN